MKKVKQDKTRQRRSLRINTVYSIVFLSFTLLIVRAAYVQIVQGKTLRQSELNTQFTKIPVLPQRGWIYDANGQVLAYDKPTMSIVLDRYTSLADSQYQSVANVLAPVLKVSAAKLYGAMKSNQGQIQVTLATDVSEAQVAFVVEHQSELPSIEVTQDYHRYYPQGDLAGQVLGYVGSITQSNEKYFVNQKGYLATQTVGVTGLENQYESKLQGKPGYDLVTVDAAGNAIGSVGAVSPVGGDNLQLALDGHEEAESQMIIQTLIDKAPNKSSIADASAVMLNVKTGGVVSMVSYPYLDPNWYTNGSWTQHKNYLQNSGAQLNNVIQTVGYPGSTVKPANLLAALKAGVVTPNTVIQDNGLIYIGSQRKNEDMGLAFGAVNPIRAIAVSSDVFFYQVGLWFGKWFGSSESSGGSYPKSDGTYQHYLNTDYAKGLNQLFQGENDFGLGALTGIDLPSETQGVFENENYLKGNIQQQYNLQASEKSIAKTGQYVNYGSPATLADAGIGQSQMFTPMELGEYAMTLANNGTKLKPHLLDNVYDANTTPTSGGAPIQTVKTTVTGQVKDKAADFALVKQAMYQVTTGADSTAYGVFTNDPYKVAAKTGTAQIYIHGKPTDNSVFICYAPLDHPIVAVAVMVPGGGYGASLAGVIAEKMINAYFNEHHESFMPKSGWTNTAIPTNWKTSPAYQIPEKSK